MVLQNLVINFSLKGFAGCAIYGIRANYRLPIYVLHAVRMLRRKIVS